MTLSKTIKKISQNHAQPIAGNLSGSLAKNWKSTRPVLAQRLAEGIEGTAYICMRSGLYSAGRLKTTNGSITDNQIDLLMLVNGYYRIIKNRLSGEKIGLMIAVFLY